MARLPIYDAGRSLDATTLSGTYQNVGSSLETAAISFVIYNTSDVAVQLSFDGGMNDGPIVPASSVFSDWVYNKRNIQETGMYLLPKGCQIQAMEVTGAGSSGNIIINIVREDN